MYLASIDQNILHKPKQVLSSLIPFFFFFPKLADMKVHDNTSLSLSLFVFAFGMLNTYIVLKLCSKNNTQPRGESSCTVRLQLTVTYYTGRRKPV